MRYDTVHKVLMVNTTPLSSRNLYCLDAVIPARIFLEMVLGQFKACHGRHHSDLYI
jgi:hypothetical protein